MNTKLCRRCNTTKPVTEFYDKSTYCKKCSIEYSSIWIKNKRASDSEYRERMNKRSTEYIKKRRREDPSYRASTNEASKIYNRRRRELIIKHYGGKCECCGESRKQFLAIDHIKNTGHFHREEIGTAPIANWIIEHNFPPYFRVLCHNCNMALAFYGYCHQGAPSEDDEGVLPVQEAITAPAV